MGSYQKNKMLGSNIKILETFRLSNNKLLEIIKTGDKCFLIAICKDTVTLLGEVDENTLEFSESSTNLQTFGSVFSRFKISNKEEANDEEKKDADSDLD